MSIKTECFKLTNYIESLPLRDRINNLIYSLTFRSERDNEILHDRSDFGYFARSQEAQLMGYLITDFKREDIEKKTLMRVPSLTDEELEVLKSANYIIQYIIKQCCEKILIKHPNLISALDPYYHFQYPSYQIPLEEITDVNVFEPLVDEFNKCSLVQRIMAIPTSLIDKTDERKYFSIAYTFTKQIYQCGVHDGPEDFKELSFKLPRNEPESSLARLPLYLICLRNILTNISQAIYQSFISDKLVVLNENNIIDVSKDTGDIIGSGLTILIQPNGRELFSQLGDLMLVKLNMGNYKIDHLCVAHGISTNFSQEYGHTQEFRLRTVDQDLNSFFNLGKI